MNLITKVLTCHLLPVVFSPVLDVQLHSIANRPLEGMLVREKMQREQQLLEQASDPKKQKSTSQMSSSLLALSPTQPQANSHDFLSFTSIQNHMFSGNTNNNNNNPFPFGGGSV